MTEGIIQQVFKENIKFWNEGNNPASTVFKKELELLQQELIEKIKQEEDRITKNINEQLTLNPPINKINLISVSYLIGDNQE